MNPLAIDPIAQATKIVPNEVIENELSFVSSDGVVSVDDGGDESAFDGAVTGNNVPESSSSSGDDIGAVVEEFPSIFSFMNYCKVFKKVRFFFHKVRIIFVSCA